MSAQPADSEPLRSGEYARKQLFGRGLIGWSHGRRFATARRVVQPYAGAALLDYGCGDGTFLALVHDIFPHSVGAEIDPVLVEEARERFGALDGLRFIHTDEVAALPDGSFGVVTCMEVLEHCTPDAAERVIGADAAAGGAGRRRHRQRAGGDGAGVAGKDGGPRRWRGCAA